MSSPDNLVPTTAGQSSTGTSWTNINGILADNPASPALVSVSLSGASKIIAGTGFASNTMPGTATIVGIRYGGHVWADATGATIGSAGCTINSQSDASNTGVSISTTPEDGWGSGDSVTIPSGLSAVTPADVNTGSINVSLSVVGPVAGIANISANDFGLLVYYTVPNVVVPRCIVVRPGFVSRD